MTPSTGVLSDGRSAWALSGLPALERAWDAWLDAHAVARGDCLALPLRGDVASAAALLALLALGQSVLLWRQAIAADGTPLATQGLPAFCRLALVSTDAQLPTPDLAFGLVRDGTCASPVRTAHVFLATSGSTGTPKIVAYDHAALWANARNVIDRFALSAADRVILPVPLAHMYGLGAAFLPAVAVGASIRLVPEANLVRFLEAEASFDPTAAFLTPSFCHLLQRGRKQARAYRLTVLAGDRADDRLLQAHEQRHGCTVSLYGSTELGAIAAGSVADPPELRRARVGQPLPGVRLACPDAATGPFALHVDHPFACAGYADAHGVPRLDATTCQGRWRLTQDLGDLDDNGRLRVLGRIDDTVKRDGVLVAFADVERALLGIDGVDTAVVLAGGDTPRGRALVAVCEGAAAAQGLRAGAQRVLPSHAVPDRFIVVAVLPRTATGKPDRAAVAGLISTQSRETSDGNAR